MPTPGVGEQAKSLFIVLTRDEVDYLASKGVHRRLPKNSLLICEGDESDSLYVLLDGKVKIYAEIFL